MGIGLDYYLGEPKRFHPLVGFGSAAQAVEKKFNKHTYVSGLLVWLLMALPCVVVAFVIGGNVVVDSLLIYLAIGRKSLVQHAQAIMKPLLNNDTAAARIQLQKIVSRDVAHLDNTGIAKASVESVLENASDSTFAALFWYLVAGAPGVVLYRVANTLDAMWGYRSERFTKFGYVSAKVDDILNYIPARLVAFSYALLGNYDKALSCWRSQAPLCDSPNAGPVMAAGAGALSISLGGSYRHANKPYQKPALGIGKAACAADIKRAITLMNNTLLLWLGVIVVLGAAIALGGN